MDVTIEIDDPEEGPDDTAVRSVDSSDPGASELIRLALRRAMHITGAEFGNVQLVDADTGALRIVAHHGFDEDFLRYFARVGETDAASGRAASTGAQVVIRDVNEDDQFAAHRDIAAATGFRAVQSSPITDRGGALVGIISTYFAHPTEPDPRSLAAMRALGVVIGAMLEAQRQRPAGSPPPSEAVLHAALDTAVAATVELVEARETVDHLEQALRTRLVIEQAKGIIAAERGTTIDAAFATLRNHARNHGRKIHDVAHAVVNLGLRPPP